MSQILVRNVEKETIERLKERAQRNGRSLEAEARVILSREARRPTMDHEAALKLADEIRSRFGDRQLSDSAEIIREARDR